MMRFALALMASLAVTAPLVPHRAEAQTRNPDEVVWVQIEAQPSLSEATDRARAYATLLEDVNGFSLGGGWYGIAVGPYRRADAQTVLRQYVREGLVPRDSFIQLSSRFRQQFWPVGANVLEQGVIDAPGAVDGADPAETGTDDVDIAELAESLAEDAGEDATGADTAGDAEADAEAQAEAQAAAEAEAEAAAARQAAAEAAAEAEAARQAPDETVAEARRSERALSGDERRQLQIALKWAGYYDAGIDGAFGRGTRASMSAWQEANGIEPTGVLTTGQRALLLQQYNAVLDGLGLQVVRDDKAGIEMVMPTAEVTLETYEPPFVQYNSSGDIGARVLLISQPGDQDTLFGLYEIMQTLEIVPLDGPRERKNRSFEIIGENGRIVSQTQVSLENGQIKGFTLIWPAGDEERRRRVIAEMSKSFTRLPGVLNPAEGSGADQAIDLLAGLQIRQPTISRSGFFVDQAGAVATTSQVVQSCGRITIDGDTEAQVLANDAASGVAIVKPKATLAPLAVAALGLNTPRRQSEVSVAGYSYEGVLSAATLTFGTLSDTKGLEGDPTRHRLSLEAKPGDAGGPVFDESGNVVGMLLPAGDENRALPEDVSFAINATTLADVAAEAGLTLNAGQAAGAAAPRDLRRAAQGMTVLVSCWE